ncbi:allatostatin-A receptor-like [Clytia hemisphaerica]|uniref:G-protein coupled receptors family 1 profile domain-containing protein n=1 Tax=Clytia hemisphaerica TaxID=252671 RepID=A0A7M5TYC1_9CNID|eukprot:TCONS_00015031-protein
MTLSLADEFGSNARILAAVSWFMSFLFGLIGNIFIISTISCILKYRKNTPNMLILILTMTDLFCVLVVYIIPGIMYVMNKYLARSWLCDIQTFFLIFTNVQSMILILTITFERYYAVAKPYLYQEHMTYSRRKLALFNIACLSVSMVFSLPTIIQNNHNNIVYFPGTFCMIDLEHVSAIRIVFNVIFYVVILSIFILLNVLGNTLSVCTVRKMSNFRQQHSIGGVQQNRHSEEFLFIRLCVVSCLVSMVVWVPVLVLFILGLAKVPVDDWYTMLAFRLAALHSVVNPWLHPILRKRFRNALVWHITLVLYYMTCTLINRPSNTLSEVMEDTSNSNDPIQQPKDEGPEEGGPNDNIMMNIAQRNIVDHVDAPTPVKSYESASESYDMRMQSVSKDHDVIEKTHSDEDNSSDNKEPFY